MAEIRQKENKILRQKAKEVLHREIKSAKIKKVISDMKKALATQGDGVAIAAPQIGEPLRIFVVSGRIFSPHFTEASLGKLDLKKSDFKKYPDLVFINPKIIKLSKKKVYVPEGCLSVRWLYGEVKRSTNATIEAYDEHGEKLRRGAGGLLAQIFQHEIDHLGGILFIDKAKNLQEILPEKQKNAK